MSESISRRDLIRLAGGGAALSVRLNAQATAFPERIEGQAASRRLLTAAGDFEDVNRNNPPPSDLTIDQLRTARLTPETWRLEVVPDDSAGVPRPKRLQDGTAIDLPTLEAMANSGGVRYLKAMQCLNIAQPLGQGLWEGVPLRDILALLGPLNDVRRLYYWGYHNEKPEQLFQSSLSYSQAMETPPGELPAFLAIRLNGEPLPLERGGPVRLVVPWAHGFKSIKWLQKIVLTNDYKANDTYAQQNNDPESWLKSAAYLDELPETIKAGDRIEIRGAVIAGRSGVTRVECWVRSVEADAPRDLPDDDPAWAASSWQVAVIDAEPEDWSSVLPAGVASRSLLGFDRDSGRAVQWPPKYGMAGWSLRLDRLEPGTYDVRARAVDLNGFAQPEPRPNSKSGRNGVPVERFRVVG